LAFPPSAELPHLDSSRVHLGLAIAVSLAVILALFSRFSCAGFKAKVIGENPLAAAYAHYKVNRYLIVAMLLSGAVAALAGFSQVSAIEGRLRSGLSPGYGYTGFLVCFLARGNFLAIILGSILLGGFLSGADSLQLSEKLPFATVNILQGAIFLFLLASEQSVKKLAGKLETRLARKAMQSAPQVVPVEVEAAIK
jgi:simple sugar transport system permease protein